MNVEPTILLIDDDKDVLFTIGDFLRLNGYLVTTATNGEEALRQLAGEKPDLIILDINMPKMNGLAFLANVQANPEWATIPVYVFTGRANMEQYFKEVKVAGFMAKPCLPDKLLSDIKNILAHKIHIKVRQKNGGQRKLLLVEPDERRREELSKQFTQAGFVVITANVEDVVQKAIDERPDGIAMQMIMSGMNGTQVASILRVIPATRNLPILIYDDTITGAYIDSQSQDSRLQTIVVDARNKDLLPLMQDLMKQARLFQKP